MKFKFLIIIFCFIVFQYNFLLSLLSLFMYVFSSRLLKLINKHCKQQSIAYDTCVNNNKLDPESKCLEQFRALYLCSQVIQEGAKAGDKLRRIEKRTSKINNKTK